MSGLNVPTVYITLRGILILEIVSGRGGWVGEWFERTKSVYHTKRDLDPWD